jgi:hypothetical protein
MIKYQNYKHYKLPITINPLDYGKIIKKIDELNLFIIQISKTNIVLLTQYDLFNHVEVYKEGDLRFEYNDHKLNNNSFSRSIKDQKFTFKDNKLIKINRLILVILLILIVLAFITSPENTSNMTIASLSSTNIIKLRKTQSIHS